MLLVSLQPANSCDFPFSGIGLALVEILLKGGNKVANYSRSTTPELQALHSQYKNCSMLGYESSDTNIIPAKYGASLLLIKGDL